MDKNGRPRRGRVKHESNFLHENRDIPWLVLYIVYSLDHFSFPLSPRAPFPTLPYQGPSEKNPRDYKNYIYILI